MSLSGGDDTAGAFPCRGCAGEHTSLRPRFMTVWPSSWHSTLSSRNHGSAAMSSRFSSPHETTLPPPSPRVVASISLRPSRCFFSARGSGSPGAAASAVLAASATSSPCGLLPRPGHAPRRLQLGATDAVDADEPAWLQSAADAVAAAARAPPHEAALACARRWAVENAVLVAWEWRVRSALRAWGRSVRI